METSENNAIVDISVLRVEKRFYDLHMLQSIYHVYEFYVQILIGYLVHKKHCVINPCAADLFVSIFLLFEPGIGDTIPRFK